MANRFVSNALIAHFENMMQRDDVSMFTPEVLQRSNLVPNLPERFFSSLYCEICRSKTHRVLAAFNALPTNHFARKPLPGSDVKSFFDDPDRALSKNFPYTILPRFGGLRALVRNMTYLERQKATGEYGHRAVALGGTTGLSLPGRVFALSVRQEPGTLIPINKVICRVHPAFLELRMSGTCQPDAIRA